jgi:GNAT superfamily N-acetyltransferase/N-acetylglutamate synthase-like GNAT family acetyltransferase
MTSKSFFLRRFGLSDTVEVTQLLSTVFKTHFSSEWWNWKYKHNPAGFWGEQGDIWVAESSDGIIGYYAVMPERMKFGSETVTVAQSIDTATHPDYRGLGIFPTLAEKVYSDAQNRYRFLYGFPSKMAYKGFLRLGWNAIQMNGLVKFLDYEDSLRNFLGNTLLFWSGKTLLKSMAAIRSISSKAFTRENKDDSVEIDRIHHFSNDINDFWESLRPEYEMAVERQVDFLNWRFSEIFGNYQLYVARSAEEKIIGYMALRKTKMREADSLVIVDIQTMSGYKRCLSRLVNTAVEFAKEEQMDLIYCCLPQWHNTVKMLSQLGFISLNWIPKRVSQFNDYAILYPYDEKNLISKARQRWFYTLADTDYA